MAIFTFSQTWDSSKECFEIPNSQFLNQSQLHGLPCLTAFAFGRGLINRKSSFIYPLTDQKKKPTKIRKICQWFLEKSVHCLVNFLMRPILWKWTACKKKNGKDIWTHPATWKNYEGVKKSDKCFKNLRVRDRDSRTHRGSDCQGYRTGRARELVFSGYTEGSYLGR